MNRPRPGALAGALLLPAALLASGKPDPAATTFSPVGDLKAGGDVVLHWTGVSKVASDDATVSFAVRGPRDEDYIPVGSFGQGKVREAQALEEVLTWSPADGPGRYLVAASITAALPQGGSWAKSDVVILDVAKDGSVSVGSHEPPTADQLLRREMAKSNPAALAGLQFGRGALPDVPGLLGGALPEKTANTPFTVKGKIFFTDRPYTSGAFGANVAAPARGCYAEVWEDEPGLNDTFIGETNVAADGSFSVAVPNNNDGPGEGGRDIYVRFAAANVATVVRDWGGKAYRYTTITKSNWPGGTMDLGTTTISLALSGPFNIADATLKGYDYAVARGASPASLDIYWGENSSEGSYYHSSDEPFYIAILGKFSDPDEFDDDVILHEYAHYLMDVVSVDKSQGGDHSWFSDVSPQLAWSEGWANFYPGVIRNNRHYVDHTAASFSMRNRETPGVGKPGLDNEGAICGVLWDIWDSSSDYPDSLNGGIAKIWPIFDNDFSASKYCTFEDYYAGYKARKFADRPKVDLIMDQFGIKLGVEPKLLSPSGGGFVLNHSDIVTVKWEGFDTPTVDVTLYRDDAPIDDAMTVPNNGSTKYTIPEFVGEGTKFDFLVQSSDGLQWDFADEYLEIASTEEDLDINNPANASEISTSTDRDWYRFVVTTIGTVTMETRSGAAPALTNSVLELYGPNTYNFMLASDDDAGLGSMSKIVKVLSPGTYYLKVTGKAGTLGKYTIRVTRP